MKFAGLGFGVEMGAWMKPLLSLLCWVTLGCGAQPLSAVEPLTFAVLADTHIDVFKPVRSKRLEDAIEILNRRKPAFR